MENVWSLFFNWMAENPIRATVIISAVVIALCILLGFVLPARSARRKREKEQRWRDARTVKTLGFIRSAKHTGRSVNDNPEFRFVVDALAEDGTFFDTTVTEIIPRAQLPMCAVGAPLSIRYDPADRSHAIGDDNPDADVLNERIARYQCRRHPGELTYEQRMELNRNSVVKKALLESLRLTGKEEAGDWEAKVTVRITDNEAGDTVMNRTLYLNDKMLKHMVPGKYIGISVVPGKKDFFGKLYIVNCGCLPENWTLENLMSKHASSPYNPNIAHVFYLAGFIESWGRGIEKICSACEKDGVPQPEYTINPGDIMIKFTAPEDRVIRSVTGRVTEKVTDKVTDTLDETSLKILNLLAVDPAYTTTFLAENLSLSRKTVSLRLKMLKETGLIERIGSDRKGYWKLLK